jgi:hypothetical protein
MRGNALYAIILLKLREVKGNLKVDSLGYVMSHLENMFLVLIM